MQETTVIVFALAAIASAIDKSKMVSMPINNRGQKPRIVNGEEAVPHSIPWQAGLNVTLDTGAEAFCGGSIINNEWILTAAHCLEAVSIEVILGAHKAETKEPTQIRMVSKAFFSHKDFSKETNLNDIGLIKLPKPIEFNDNIQPISLNTETNLDGLEVTVSGWGIIADNLEQISAFLRTITVTVMPNSECQKVHNKIDNTCICTDTGAKYNQVGGGGKSPCCGDSGGPLVLNGTTLIGIVSYGEDSCELGFPGVYTRVSSFIEWINEKIAGS